jgi:hypothetical protein
MTQSPVTRRKRRDEAGRAFAGSQLQVQIYVNRRRGELDSALLRKLDAPTGTTLEWRSPLESKKFAEYMDGRFLSELGLAHLKAHLKTFWPRSGPRWDGLAIVRRRHSPEPAGYLLVEAKSYPGEILGRGCQAKGDPRAMIMQAIRLAQTKAGVAQELDWFGPLYQTANRLAHVYFLLEHTGQPVHLVNLCFIADAHRPTTREEWLEGLAAVHAALGFAGREIPHTLEVLLEARPRDELLSSPAFCT